MFRISSIINDLRLPYLVFENVTVVNKEHERLMASGINDVRISSGYQIFASRSFNTAAATVTPRRPVSAHLSLLLDVKILPKKRCLIVTIRNLQTYDADFHRRQ